MYQLNVRETCSQKKKKEKKGETVGILKMKITAMK